MSYSTCRANLKISGARIYHSAELVKCFKYSSDYNMKIPTIMLFTFSSPFTEDKWSSVTNTQFEICPPFWLAVIANRVSNISYNIVYSCFIYALLCIVPHFSIMLWCFCLGKSINSKMKLVKCCVIFINLCTSI